MKPQLQVSGQDGNIFAVLSAASMVMRTDGCEQSEIEEMKNKVFSSKNYDEALAIIGEYVEYS
jgi:hypothetical protein